MNNSNKVYKIVLTGGPCSGKTTAMSVIKQKFSDDFIVFTLPEVATMTITSGVNIIPTGYTQEDHKQLTKSICQMQINLEQYFENIAKLQKKDVIIMCDRGVCDNFAYCTPENKQAILEETGWSENFVCNERYNQVIHLVTAAIGAEQHYTKENNEARWENLEQAKLIDGVTARSWMSHQNVVMVDNECNGFNAKMDRVIRSISHLVQKPQPKYVQKFTLNKPLNLTELMRITKVKKFQDTLTFLVNNQPKTSKCLVKRKFEDSHFPNYFLFTRLNQGEYSERTEIQRIITEREYFDMLNQSDQTKNQLIKNSIRFLLVIGRSYQICTLEDVMINGQRKTELLRIRKDIKQKNNLPEFLNIQDDVTQDSKYSSINMAEKF